MRWYWKLLWLIAICGAMAFFSDETTAFLHWCLDRPGWVYICASVLLSGGLITAAIEKLPEEIERNRLHMTPKEFEEMRFSEYESRMDEEYRRGKEKAAR